ncbi:AAA domain-containing protein, putative AbiEii toxin, Type IV TA system [Arboricoccus pini]|uniref:AAA domain-containing protein, putative AbiEii toxin, Type IV TA system n=1 Tax=Arboricoccus pini TaxID=1963835 RepID=A0A212S3T8_9PROT|nr:AAA family ATPase [Arboricoccus pini]SNB79806.1 AAA domain-containing protein, putative AbiEii toxin, Type IV TA system [Arboricoccus pini]
MELVKFKVENFRSVEDSGWITVDRIGAFVGVNESGKTNLITPLWKLHPAREGEIQPTSDYPKKLFGTIRASPGKYCFIQAVFRTGDFADELVSVTGRDKSELDLVHVWRNYSGDYYVRFPNCKTSDALEASEVKTALQESLDFIEGTTALAKEESSRAKMIAALRAEIGSLGTTALKAPALKALIDRLVAAQPDDPAKTSVISPRFAQVIEVLQSRHTFISSPAPGSKGNGLEEVLEALPTFVYYSNYGNLDSEIYLPHVVQNLKREDLGSKEAAKARTLRVLFKFVGLSPAEILELGRDFKDPANPGREPTPAEAAEIGEKKRERSILLQSASALLTKRFREWWKQGDYRFRFEADGNHFRIWVADDRRPEEIELESRSTGLQWFLSFYLVFLVESEAAHQNSILLLDEPGLSLHPLAQRDLSEFFEGLTETNQILYTTHSPFLVDADHLDRARKVYVAPDGTTKATENLREGAEGPGQAGASYAVHSALNLTVAESLLLGCQPTLVEGASDQHYLTAIKTLLIRSGKITPKRELVFPPSGGAKTARMVASILTGRDDALPLVLLDSDSVGRKMANELKSSLYQDGQDRVLEVQTFVGFPESEIEDLIPAAFLADIVDRWQRMSDPEDEFAPSLQARKPIVPQIEAWAEKHGIALEKGWKVEIAKRFKSLALTRGIEAFDAEMQGKWVTLFERLAG